MEIHLKTYAKNNKLCYSRLLRVKRRLCIETKKDYSKEELDALKKEYYRYMRKSNVYLELKTKLLLLEYKERFPSLTPEHMSEMFCLNKKRVKYFFNQKYLTIPSRMNKE